MKQKPWHPVIALLAVIGVGTWGYLTAFPPDTIWRRKDVSRRIDAIVLNSKAHPDNSQHAKQLLEIANGDYSFAASRAAGALGKIGPAANPVLKDMAKLLESPDPNVRREVALAFSRLGPLSSPVLEELEAMVENSTSDSAWFSAEAIGKIGIPAKRSLPLLRRRLGTGVAQFDDSLRRAISALEDASAKEATGSSEFDAEHKEMQ